VVDAVGAGHHSGSVSCASRGCVGAPWASHPHGPLLPPMSPAPMMLCFSPAQMPCHTSPEFIDWPEASRCPTDFGDNIRIELHVKGITPAKRIMYPRTVTLRGFSPEQYNYAEGRHSPKISATVTSKALPMVRVSGTRKCEGSLLLEWSDTSHVDSGQAT
jgi:hypothetical protein